MHSHRPGLHRCLLLGVCLWASLPAFAGGLPRGDVKLNARYVISPVGDAAVVLQLKTDVVEYTSLKKAYPNSFRFLQTLGSNQSNNEIADGAKCDYDDAESQINFDFTYRGLARNMGDGDWELPVERGLEFVNSSKGDDGIVTAYFYGTQDVKLTFGADGQRQITLPAGATGVNWDASRRVLGYLLAAPATQGRGKLFLEKMTVRNRIMSCPYKAYGLGENIPDFTAQWVAKTVFTNKGSGKILNLRLNYRIPGYAEASMPQKYAELLPGQTAVNVFYPVLDKSIALIRTNTPADVILEYRWRGEDGTEHSEVEGQRTVIMGVNSFLFSNLVAGESFGSLREEVSNAPLVAAWVTRNDPVIREFAAMANKNAGRLAGVLGDDKGIGARESDEKAELVLKQCYELLRANDFSYQHPDGFKDRSVSFDPRMMQNVKLPRDTLRDRSGTCIDLAILFAAMANELGLKPYLALTSGHCLTGIELPSSQKRLWVETTGVGGGAFLSYSWDQVKAAGANYVAQHTASSMVTIDVQAQWMNGISNPELERLPDNILQEWGIKPGRVVVAVAAPAQAVVPHQGLPTANMSPDPVIPDSADFVRALTLSGDMQTSHVVQVVQAVGGARKWLVRAMGPTTVALSLNHRGWDANLYFRCSPQSVEIYSDSYQTNIVGRRSKSVPSDWIENLEKDFRRQVR